MVGSKSKILLFGRTGSGKSTVANMLIKGHLRPTLLFPTSSGVRGKTTSFQREESDDWVVVDTVGFGEGEHGSVVDAEARNKLYDFFVKISEESCNYYAYVHKWGKLDELDAQLWKFFKQAFEGVESNYVIIFTHCSPKALEENLKDIKVAFHECERYIAVDFPGDDKAETSASAKTRRNEKLRVASLERLRKSLGRFMLPSGNLCLRSYLKKGRILLMGTSARARNMIAKLLVDGTVNMTSITGVDVSTMDGTEIDGNDKDKSTVFEELEGRRWQVVNALAFDSASVGDIYDGSLTKDKAAAAASKLLASIFLTILEHGVYSHFLYVGESEKMPPAWKSALQEILKDVKWKSIRTTAVIVNYDGKVQPKVGKHFEDLTTICQIRLPNFCDSSERESDVIGQHALVVLEETLLRSTPHRFCNLFHDPYQDSFGNLRSKWLSIDSIANPTAFVGLVHAYQELQGMNRSDSSSKNLLQRVISDLSIEEVDILKCESNSKTMSRTVLRLPIKHIAVEIPCNWDKRPLSLQYLCIATIGEKRSLCDGLENDYIWGELQVVDKHHVDRKFRRLPLSVGSCSIHINNMDIWFVGVDNVIEKEFIDNLLSRDSIILWMYPYPNPLVPHEDKFEIGLHFLDVDL